MERDYLIAGLRVRMDTWGRTEELAGPYLAEPGDFDIKIYNDPSELQALQPHLSLDQCEYTTSGASFYIQLLHFDGLLLHASAIVMDGYAYLFSAPSGTGKSTHTGLWREAFGMERVQMLNDDKPALRRENGIWYAYGTPWSGKTGQNLNIKVPVAGICMLSRGEKNAIAPFTGVSAIHALLEQTVRPPRADRRARLLELLNQLFEDVPIWKMQCTISEDAARMAYEAMRPKK